MKRIPLKHAPTRAASAPKKRAGGKAVNGSQKGAAYERLIAKQFSLWISMGRTADLLWRSAGSGGRSTMRRKQTGKGIDYHASDIAPLHPDAEPFSGTFTLECKSYRSIELRQVLYDWKASIVAKWWAQACRDAASVNRFPLLVMKENQKPSLVVIGKQARELSLSGLALLPHHDVVILPLADLIDLVSFAKFRSLYAHATLPDASGNRLASDRPRTRRVPLVDL